ncbi:MAG: PKD domain-containing protein [Bacteroidetes bacterium]|nr:MAG: PKD domain-containing protein [Bacteroidota bacterium]
MVIGLITFSITARQQPGAELRIPDIAPENSNLRFIENQGQWNEKIRYRVRVNGGSLLLEDQALTWYLFQLPPTYGHGAMHRQKLKHTPPTEQQDLIRLHAYQVIFEGANPHPQLQPAHRFAEYHNYFLGQNPTRWKGGVPLYGLLTYHDLYPGTDMRLYGLGESLKYDFILAPGADPGRIQLRYEGTDALELQNGALHVRTSISEFVELPPVAYQIIDGQKVQLPCEYVLQNKLLSFRFPQGYDPEHELVIDPTLEFATLTGSSSDNWGFSATYDLEGNAYGAGIVHEGTDNDGYPTTVGAFQRFFQGGVADVVVSKFNQDGSQLLYSTYLGGAQHDQPHSLVVNDQHELYILGRTNSSNFPATVTSLDPSHNGGYDLFVARMSEDGRQLLAATFLGGSADDGVNGDWDLFSFPDLKYNYGDDARGEIIVDDQGNVYVASPTQSANFPTTTNALQTQAGGGQDGCVLKLNAGLNQLFWSTYLGGSGADAAYAMQVDAEYNVYVTGGTMSPNFPITAGAYQGSYQGGRADGFVVKISQDGRQILNGTFLGTNQLDQSYFVQLDKEENVYVYGQTEGNWPIVNPPSGQVYRNNGGKQFITKLSNDLSGLIYSTVFGSNAAVPNISPTAFLVDICENVYASGWGGKTNEQGDTHNMPVTADAIQPATDGDDMYLIVLSRDARNLLYGTYMGGYDDNTDPFGNEFPGDHLDGGTCRFDRNGVVYHAVCSGCWGRSNFPTTPGAWSSTNRSSNCNMAVFKIAFDFAGVEADFVPRDSLDVPIVDFQGCAPFTVKFENTSQEIPGSTTTTYLWDFGDNQTSTEKNPVYTYHTPGSYNVRLIITDPASCNISDTSFSLIEVFELPTAEAGTAAPLCGGDSVQLQGSGTGNGLRYSWSPASGLSDAGIAQPLAAPAATTTYTLTVTNANGCTSRDTVTVRVLPPPQVFAGNDTAACAGGGLQLQAQAPDAVSYHWEPAALLDNPDSPTPSVLLLDSAVTFVLEVQTANGCVGLESVLVGRFDIEITPDTSLCAGESVQLQAQGSNGGNLLWSPATGLDDPSSPSPLASPDVTTTYTLTGNFGGCNISKSVRVEVLPPPQAEAGPNDTLCAGQSVQLLGSGGQQYAWSPAAGLSDPALANPVASPAATTTYTLTVTDANGCSSTDALTLTVTEAPQLTATADRSICRGERVQLTASGADTYLWTGPALLQNNIPNPLAQPERSSTYLVTGTNAQGCTAEASVEVEVIPGPQTRITGPGTICIGEEVTLLASGGDNYVWSTGDTAQSITFTPFVSTVVYATALSSGCPGIPDSLSITVARDFPHVLFIPSQDSGFAPLTVEFLNFTLNASRYEWNFGTGGPPVTEESPKHVFPRAGQYQVSLTAWSPAGCVDTAVWNIEVENVAIHIPSAFSPNGDGINDDFFIGQLGMDLIQIKIFSRWGILIYESQDPEFRWDGRYKGRMLPEGVYTYLLRAKGLNGQLYEKAGTITLFR